MSDQHNADALGVASNGLVRTPNLDRLTAEGLTFTHAYCQAPLCAPARYSLLTERYVSDHGVQGNRWAQAQTLPTMVQSLRDAGYHTTALGKMHLYAYPPDVRDGIGIMHDYGFREVHEILGKYGTSGSRSDYTDYLESIGALDSYSRFLDERNPHTRREVTAAGGSAKPHWATDPAPLAARDHPDAWVGRLAAEWLSQYDGVEPFFAWVGFPGPHDPWDAPAEYDELYEDVEIPLPVATQRPSATGGTFDAFVKSVNDYCSAESTDIETIQRVRRRYYAGVSFVDEYVGGILKAVEARDLLDNTWVIYTSDHGELLGAHGLFTKWLFYEEAVRVPLIIRPPGGRHAIRVDSLVEHLDVSATIRSIAGGPPVDGSSGRSLLSNSAQLNGVDREVVRSECQGFGMWRTRDYKIVVHEDSGDVAQLFDLRTDPNETNDVKDAPEYRKVRDELLRTTVLPAIMSV
jgi:choline-sulfatase